MKTGIATSDSSPAARSELYLASESSETSHSRKRVKRKKISSTGRCRTFQRDALDDDGAAGEVADVVVVGDGERQRQPLALTPLL